MPQKDIQKKETKEKQENNTIVENLEKIKQKKVIKKNDETKKQKNKIKARLIQGLVITENSADAQELFHQSVYGTLKEGKVQLSMVEALYLLEKEKIEIYDSKKIIIYEDFIKKASKQDKNFLVRYSVYKDLRSRGYIVKTALKFGADFRVYDRGIKPGQDHAKWVVFPVKEDSTLTWYEFAAKNRVAHSTKKRLLIAVVDDEDDVSYWECRWIRP